jgi:hypothetical protein
MIAASLLWVLGGNLSSLGRHEMAVHNLDIWHAHRQSSREEPMHPILHKSIIINVLWPIAEILHVSFSAPFRPKTSEAGIRGNVVSTNCFLDVLALAALRSSGGYGTMAHNGMVTTLPKTRPGAPGPSQHNRLLYLLLAILPVPKTVAFGKDRDGGSHPLLPHRTASLVLGLQ